MKKTFKDYLKGLFIRVTLHPYSKEWDSKLLQLMKENKFEKVSKYTAKLGKNLIWVSNHPYASFESYEPYLDARPARSTVIFAQRKLIHDLLNND